jgi:hypothetical protein
VLLAEESHPVEHLFGPLLGGFEAPFERGIFLLYFERSFWISPRLARELIELLEPSLGGEGTLAIIGKLVAKVANEPAQLGECGSFRRRVV